MVKTDSIQPDYSLESALHNQGYMRIAGIDEAGRGPWAGPVVAAAVVLDVDNIPAGLNDSKKLSEARREELFEKIVAVAAYGVGVVSVAQIDQINILKATFKAMEDATKALASAPDFALIDGNKKPQIDCPCEAIVKGDGRSVSIAAASIIAKVTRDRMMREMALAFPGYGFERHKGYGTAQHQAALKSLGPCPHHRKTFTPIRSLLESIR
jgi:ribonuclease HII